MTGADVLAAEGLAFTFVGKGGVVLSAISGHGFVIRKVLKRCLHAATVGSVTRLEQQAWLE